MSPEAGAAASFRYTRTLSCNPARPQCKDYQTCAQLTNGWGGGWMGGWVGLKQTEFSVQMSNENPRIQKRYANSWKLLLSLVTEAHANFLQGESPGLIQSLLIISWHINFKTFICTHMYLYVCVSICEAWRSSVVSMFLSHASYFFFWDKVSH